MILSQNLRLRAPMRMILSGTAVLFSLSYASSAIAADTAGDALDEITVTAQRRTENARDVPISITVFSATQIEQQNFQGVESYFAQTPNVSFTTEGTRDRKQLSLRGVSDQLAADNNIREGSFGFNIDGFNVAQGTSNPEIVDIDQIEVLRGPQGTYFGRNSVGGAFNITTKQPTNEFFAEASAQYSTFNTVDSHVILNLPLIDNVLAVRIVGRDQTSDGNIKNINQIGGGNNSKYTYGKIIVRYTPTERVTIDTTGTVSTEHVGMRNGVPSGVLGDFSADVLFSGPPYNGQAIPDGVGFYPNNTTRVNFNRPQDDGTRFNYVTNKVKYNADFFTLTNIVGFLYSDEFEGGDIDGSSLDFFYEHESIKRSSLSEELRLESIKGNALDWNGGLYYGHDYGKADQHTFAGSEGANLFGVPNNFELTSSQGDSSDLTVAVFGDVDWHVNPALTLSVGARYTHETVANDGYNTSGGVVMNYVNGDASFNNFSPRVNAVYQLSPQTNVYGTVSRGFKAGGIEALPVAQGGNQVYKPETLTNYEFGVKSESADKRLRWEADVFYMDWKDIQADFSYGVQTGSGVSFITGISNAASAKSYGFETEFAAKLSTDFLVGAGAGYDRAHYGDYNEAAKPDGTQGNLSGATLPNSPKWTLHANGEYSHKFAADVAAFVRLEWYDKGGIKPDQNSEFHTGFPWDVPSFNVWNLRTGVTRETWTVTAFAENLFDRKYYTNAYEKAFATGMFLEPSYRSFGVRLTVKTK